MFCLIKSELTTAIYVQGFRVSVMAFLNLLLVLGIAIIAFKMQHLKAHRIPKSNSHVDWRAIRHLWLD